MKLCRYDHSTLSLMTCNQLGASWPILQPIRGFFTHIATNLGLPTLWPHNSSIVRNYVMYYLLLKMVWREISIYECVTYIYIVLHVLILKKTSCIMITPMGIILDLFKCIHHIYWHKWKLTFQQHQWQPTIKH